MPKKNPLLDMIQRQAEEKARAEYAEKLKRHVEIDTMAMLLSAQKVFKAGPGRAGKYVSEFLDAKIEISKTILQELDEDQSEKKELVILPRDLAARMKEILGPEGWAAYKTLFPMLHEYWEE